MSDREKVLKGLECCLGCDENSVYQCEKCPYRATEDERKVIDWCCHLEELRKDALELLKGQDIPRCRECSHWQKADRPDVGDEFPDTGYCGLFEREYLATDFCSYHTDAYWGWADRKAVKRDE